MSEPVVALTVDVELLGHTPAFRSVGGNPNEFNIGLDGIDFLRKMFATNGATSTFFVVSSIADDYQEVISRVAEDGHEIGSHTHTHPMLTDLDESGRRSEVETSRERLQSIAGEEVVGFRAPVFDLPEDHFESLAECGYTYDSSIVPCRTIPGWYGGQGRRQHPGPASSFQPNSPDVMELPVSAMPWLRLPLSGLWLRLLGRQYALRGIQWLVRRGLSPVLYVHPWEVVDIPEIPGLPRRMYFRTGEWMRNTIEMLLNQPFEYRPARELVVGISA